MRRVYAAIAVLVTCAPAPAASLLPSLEQTENLAPAQPTTEPATQQSESKPQSTTQPLQEAQQPTEQPVKDAQQYQPQTQQTAYYYHPQFGWVAYNPSASTQSYGDSYSQPSVSDNSASQQGYSSNYYPPSGYQPYQFAQPALGGLQGFGGGGGGACRT